MCDSDLLEFAVFEVFMIFLQLKQDHIRKEITNSCCSAELVIAGCTCHVLYVLFVSFISGMLFRSIKKMWEGFVSGGDVARQFHSCMPLMPRHTKVLSAIQIVFWVIFFGEDSLALLLNVTIGLSWVKYLEI